MHVGGLKLGNSLSKMISRVSVTNANIAAVRAVVKRDGQLSVKEI